MFSDEDDSGYVTEDGDFDDSDGKVYYSTTSNSEDYYAIRKSKFDDISSVKDLEDDK
ncbi:unnamed protein product [Strongylus vulgaris]|uniref:Uncharacterized protein n=1 Tax=Strongylus vulgaris TaxID=40348 RepID=A0A3P7IUF1_STRVU|nr:unnamed protein product [Strongylus vulgaris]